MIVAYADPPYVGKARKFYRQPEVDHQVLIDQLVREYPDGWALSCSSPSLRTLLPLCPPDVRVGAWVKRFAVWKKGQNPVFAWEPVIFCGGHAEFIKGEMVSDWVSSVPTFGTGVVGAKPDEFAYWIFRMLGLRPGDELVDLFPGSGAVTRAWQRWQQQLWFADDSVRAREVRSLRKIALDLPPGTPPAG